MQVADLNGDGIPDIVTANYGSNTVSVLLGSWQWHIPARAELRCWQRSGLGGHCRLE